MRKIEQPSIDAGRHSGNIARLIILVAIALAFWPLCVCDFTSWDDTHTVSQNPTLNPPTLHSFKIWWTRPVLDMWDPVTYMVNGALAGVATVAPDPATGIGLNSYVFHTANLLLHIGSAVLVFQILRRLAFTIPSACAAALLFGLHPVQVETVGWVSGLKDVLYAFLALAAIQLYLTRSRPRFWLATALFVLATFSKPTAVIVPLVLLIIILYQQGRIGWRVWQQMALWVILSMPCIIITNVVQPAPATERIAFWKRLLVALDALAFYIYKLLWPVSLGLDYGRNPKFVFRHGWAYWTWIVPVGIAVALWFAPSRERADRGRGHFRCGIAAGARPGSVRFSAQFHGGGSLSLSADAWHRALCRLGVGSGASACGSRWQKFRTPGSDFPNHGRSGDPRSVCSWRSKLVSNLDMA